MRPCFGSASDLALVQTIDFFTPIVDDPYDFGRIAAANALSDVYAMGATPLIALNVVAFPLERLGVDVLGAILRGGADVVSAAGATVAGGHSIDDPEPKYGLAVTGVVHPDEVLTNAGAAAGDVLVLTKPLGVGAIVTARKRGLSRDDDLLDRAVEVMAALNAPAASAARDAGAHAVTDVTGFGLLGHLHNLCRASAVAAVIDAERVPAIEGALELLDDPEERGGVGWQPAQPRARRHVHHLRRPRPGEAGAPVVRRHHLGRVAGGGRRGPRRPGARPGRGTGGGGAARHNPRAVNEYVERPGPGGPPGLQNRGERGRPRWKVRLLRRSV